MFEITFLGTSASAPSPKRNLPAYMVQHDEYRFLVDCGEGTQRQILQSGIGSFKRLNRILITHGHLDHILGLGGLLSTFMRGKPSTSLRSTAALPLWSASMICFTLWCSEAPDRPCQLSFKVLTEGVFFDAPILP